MVKYCRRRGGGESNPPKIPKLPCLGKLFRFRGGGQGPDPVERLQDDWSSGFHYVLLDGIFPSVFC